MFSVEHIISICKFAILPQLYLLKVETFQNNLK